MSMSLGELDPLFVKALKLLHSRSKDSTEQLKQMLDDVLQQRKGDRKEVDKGVKSNNSETKGYGSKKDNPEAKKREAEKRDFEKLKMELTELSQEPVTKKPRSDSPASTGSDGKSKSDRDKDKPKTEKHKDKSKEKELEKTRKEREKEKQRMLEEKEKEREREREREREKEREKERKYEEDTESDDSGSMDTDNFAMDMGITCVVCKQFDVSSGNQLVECQECHNLYHQECHRPPVTEQDVNDPRFVWYCSRCTKNMKKMVSKPAKSKVTPVPVIKEVLPIKPVKTETPIVQPFRRMEALKSSLGKESSSSAGAKPFSGLGLAALAANLSSTKAGSKGSDMGKFTSSKTSDVNRLGSKAMESTKLGSSKTLDIPKASSSKGYDHAKLASKFSDPGKLSGKSSDFSSKSAGPKPSDAFSKALAGTGPGAGAPGKSKTPSTSGPLKGSGSSIMNADKRVQIMKKKAAARLQEKRATLK